MDKIKRVNQILWIILLANLAVAITKITIGHIINSASITADGLHSLTDGASNIVGLIGVWLASKPEDKEHPYGHKKFENLTGLFISAMLVIIGGRIIFEAIYRFSNPVTPHISLESLVMMLVTLFINIWVAVYEYQQGKKLGSAILISDSMHTKSDIYVSLGVIFTLIGMKLGLSSLIDPVASLVVSAFILHAAYEVFQTTCAPLLDTAVVDPHKVKEIVLGFEEVKDVHDIKSRGREDDAYLDFHIIIEPDMNVIDCHRLTDSIEEELKKSLNQSMEIHIRIEPFYNVQTEILQKKA